MDILTDRLSLSLMDESSQDEFFRLYQCPKVMRHIGEPCSNDYLSRTFRNALLWNKHSSLNQKIWKIEELESSAFVGIVLAKKIFDPFEAHEIGIMLNRSKNMKGYPIEALGSVVKHLQQNHGICKFVGNVHKKNIPAAKLLIKLQFCVLNEVNNYRLFSLTAN